MGCHLRTHHAKRKEITIDLKKKLLMLTKQELDIRIIKIIKEHHTVQNKPQSQRRQSLSPTQEWTARLQTKKNPIYVLVTGSSQTKLCKGEPAKWLFILDAHPLVRLDGSGALGERRQRRTTQRTLSPQ